MPKKAEGGTNKEAIQEKKEQILNLTNAFCDAHLNADYKRLCKKLIDKMARKRPPPFLRGRLEIWAAGIVHALGTINFLFDPSAEPHVSAGDIAAYFEVAPGSASQKAGAIRDMFQLSHFSLDFMTKDMKEGMAPTLELLAQTEMLLGGDTVLRNDVGDVIQEGQFIAAESRLQSRFFKLVERYQQQGATPALGEGLQKLIAEDPDFYDPYLMLRDLLRLQGDGEAADVLLEIAYSRALSRVVLPSGDWVPALEWGWLENRHIIRTLLNKALSEWTNGRTEEALSLFRNLLRSNPGDNIGARWYILAIRLGMSLEALEAEIGGEYGYDAMKTEDWFAKHHTRFPEDFDWWKEAVEYEA